MQPSGAQSIVKNTSWLAGGQVVVSGLRGLYFLLLARFLDTGAYGGILYAFGWEVALLPLTDWGLGILLGREVGRDRQGSRALIDDSFVAKLALATAVALAASAVGWAVEPDGGYRTLLLLCSFTLIPRSIAVWCGDVFKAHEISHYQVLNIAVFRTVEILAGTAALFLGASAVTIALIHLVSWILQAASGFVLTTRLVHRVNTRAFLEPVRRLFWAGLPIAVTFSLMLLSWNGSLILVRHLASDPAVLGGYGLMIQIFAIAFIAPQSWGRAALPVLSRFAGSEEAKDRRFVETAVQASLLWAPVAFMLGALFTPEMIETLFRAEYAFVSPYLPAMLPLVAIASINMTLFFVFMAQGRPGPPLLGFSLGCTVMAAATILGFSTGDLTGIVAALAAGFLTTGVVLGGVYGHSRRLDYAHCAGKPLVAAAAAVLVFTQVPLGSAGRFVAGIFVLAAIFWGLGGRLLNRGQSYGSFFEGS